MEFRFELRISEFFRVTCQNGSAWAQPTLPLSLNPCLFLPCTPFCTVRGSFTHMFEPPVHSFTFHSFSLRKSNPGMRSLQTSGQMCCCLGKEFLSLDYPEHSHGRGVGSWCGCLFGPKISSSCEEGHSQRRARAIPPKP